VKVLAGDVGGSRVRLATYHVADGLPVKIRTKEWKSTEHEGILALVLAYLAEEDERGAIERACLGVAGPVVAGVSRMTSRGWTVEAAAVERATGIGRVLLLHDFEAVGHAVPFLEPADVVVLQEGDPRTGGMLALVGAGTGLGVGYLDTSFYPPHVFASEGGHASFAPRSEVEWGLARHLIRLYGRASRERVVSGQGLLDAYQYLSEAGFEREQERVRSELGGAREPAAVVSRHALENHDPLCRRALDLFIDSYGAVAGDIALTLGARGGVLIAGGIAPRILPALRDGRFIRAFRDKGRMREYVERIPVRVALAEDLGLRGAAVVAARL
jgi:glucokinase